MGIGLGRVLLVSGAILVSAAAHRIYGYISRAKNLSGKAAIPHLDRLKRVRIFSDNVISSPHLSSLVSYRNSNGQAVMKIDEDKLETTLRPFIREHLRRVFVSRGWNFDELEGRIYYSIVGASVEVYVLWKKHRFLPEYTNYDRFSVNF